MSALNNHMFHDLQDTLCYVQCGYCTTILLVSVPCSSFCNKIVTVRCGHCTSLLSLNLTKASLLPFHLFASFNQTHQQPKPEVDKEETVDANKKSVDLGSPVIASSDEEDKYENVLPVNQVNKPPEKRQRAPFAYNCFIKEEIKRLKALYPNMTHKQAFSTAAKNWAHVPPSQHRGSCSLGDGKMAKVSVARNSLVPRDRNGFLEREASSTTPFHE
uniref:INNER NO OUTER n=1 Tax=Capsicum pubescens TaxID=113210 RepID=A0A2U9G5V5_9SOLA|nr:INNER NO OUTER [Capsicum pubescens]